MNTLDSVLDDDHMEPDIKLAWLMVDNPLVRDNGSGLITLDEYAKRRIKQGLETADGRIKELTAEKALLLDENGRLKNAVNNLRESYQEKSSTIEELEAENERLHSDYQTLFHQANDVAAENVRLTAELAESHRNALSWMFYAGKLKTEIIQIQYRLTDFGFADGCYAVPVQLLRSLFDALETGQGDIQEMVDLTAELTHLQTQAQELRDKLMLAGYSSIATAEYIRENERRLREAGDARQAFDNGRSVERSILDSERGKGELGY